MAHHDLVTHPIVLRHLEVAAVVDVTDRMRRVTLVGEELAGFSRDGLDLPPFVSTGFDDHVKIVLAEGGDLATVLPVQRAQSIDWPDAPHGRVRDYTPRRWDPETGALELDFVRHGDGPAARWAEGARVGDRLHIAGPKSSVVLPAALDWVLLAGDETALPAIGRFLDERPTAAPVQVVVEVHDDSARQELALRPGDTLRWVVAAEGATSGLTEAVQAADWWPGEVYAWAAAESRSLLSLRRWLTRDRQVPRSHQNITGYWHERAPVAVGEPAPVDAATLLTPLPWFASRTALDVGLLDALADGPRSPVDLAGALGLPAGPVRTLVDYLVSVEICALTRGQVALGPVGEALLGDDHLRAEVEDGLEARTVAALAELTGALTGPPSGPGAYERRYARTLWTDLRSDASLFADQVEDATGFRFVAAGLPSLASWSGVRTAAVTGVGVPTVLGCAGLEEVAFTVVEEPVPLAVLREQADRSGVTFSGSSPEVDLAVSALALSYRTDDEARALLVDLAAVADRLVLVEEVAEETPATPHTAEHQLLRLVGTGTPARRVDDVRRLAESAGWRLVAQTSLGWCHEALELVR